ncbi:MAG: hypothetical protein IRZ02_06815 [Acidothermus sp.]|nr:hypothetical protein [Acidothermus sp.]MCL6537200.1 hypothetical protein [Acidothermus sp.]
MVPRAMPSTRATLATRAVRFVGLCLAVAGTLLATVNHPAHAADPSLASDATGPMFAGVTDLSPGTTAHNCVRLSYQDLTGTGTLGMTVSATGGLAPYLLVEVAAGDGGGYGDCSGFSGTTVYSGTLADLAAQHADLSHQVVLAETSGSAGSLTVSIAVRLADDNGAQGKSASAMFSFALTAPDNAAVTPSPSPSSAAIPTPSPSSGEVRTSTPPSQPPTTPVVPPRQTVEVPLTGNTSHPSGFSAWLGRLGAVAGRIVRAVAPAAAPTVKGISWTVLVTPIPLLFLLLQHRIDRRDPKLAEAPVYRDQTLPFDDDPAAHHLPDQEAG